MGRHSPDQNQSHNVVANGSGKSSVANTEPYWGDMPQGTTYNTIIGHGSDEDPHAQHRAVPLHEESQATSRPTTSDEIPQGTGIYNTVIGHGSNEDDHAHSSEIYAKRAFPLGSSDSSTDHSTIDSTKGKDESEHSKDKYPIDAGAIGGGSSAASKLLHTHKENKDEKVVPKTEETMNSDKLHHDNTTSLRNEPEFPRNQSEQYDADSEKSKEKKMEEAGAAAGGGSLISRLFHRNKDSKEQPAEPNSPVDKPSTQSSKEVEPETLKLDSHKHADDNRPKSGRHAGEVGAAAGAGGLIYKLLHSNKENDHDEMRKEKKVSSSDHIYAAAQSQQQQQFTTAQVEGHGHSISTTGTHANSARNAEEYTSHTNSNEPKMHSSAAEAYTPTSLQHASPSSSHHSHESDNNQIRTGLAGIGAGAGVTYGASKLADRHETTKPEHNPAPSPGSMTTDNDQLNHASPGETLGTNVVGTNYANSNTSSTTPPSQSGNGQDSYNHLRSGNPSGIAISKHSHPSTSPTPASSSKSINGGGDPYNHLSSGTPSGIAIAPKHESNASKRSYNTSSHQSSSSLTSMSDANTPDSSKETSKDANVGNIIPAAATAASVQSEQGKMMHKCTKCGEDNDISHYFK
ncbi:uncharacterized protein BCR38DRAFT_489702 [Pseudomassariella vexata]|uniref:Uncharacterized protein n=1 Tax=Pseudomassariella vexata TaxID=1141098 RepID=A0A1Y2DG22_9PEZI|nr:uncharacterized protein BCR38DRAFT_489702 [Pseudomassariella vexata]ORY58232.1 hypothetical protein BCR38DRAFT_489702 [Pseudomassariella vexata]